MSDIKVSVIIPVYNAQKHLADTLECVCSQTLRDIEIICVDDGSTDSSREIIGEFKLKDSRISLIKQENLYAGAARNNGLKLPVWNSFAAVRVKVTEKVFSPATT